MIHWLLAATSLFSYDFGLEPHEKTELILWIIVAIISLIPIVIFLISYTRVKSAKLLITALAFSLFFVKALVLSVKLFIPDYVDGTWWWVAATLDIVIICLIAYSLSKKA